MINILVFKITNLNFILLKSKNNYIDLTISSYNSIIIPEN